MIEKKLSEKTKQKMSISHKGKPSGMLGKSHSRKTKEKMSKAHKGMKFSKEHIKKLSESHKGQKISQETKDKMSKNRMGIKRLPCTEKTRKKMSKAQSKRTGEKSANWKGGISLNRKAYKQASDRKRRARKKGAEGSHTQGDWENLKAQYNWTCPCCGKQEPEIQLAADHIIPLSRGGSDNIENIQPLCKVCNSRKYTKIIKYVQDKF